MWSKTLRINQDLDNAEVILSELAKEPDLLVVFGDTASMMTPSLVSMLATRFPSAVQIGCSTGTYIDGGHLFDHGVAVCAIGFREAKLKLATAAISGNSGSFDAGVGLARQLMSDDLTAVMILSPGLDVNGSELVRGLQVQLGSGILISGGLAGDGARFAQTAVWANGRVDETQATAIGFYGRSLRFSHGVAGGWSEFGPSRWITRSEGTVLYELDGMPALDLYEKYLGDEAKDLPGAGLIYPLKIWDDAFPNDHLVRTLLSVDHKARSITLAGDVPTGWHARLMRGSIEDLIDGAADAARHAAAQMQKQGCVAEICFMISCVGRRLLMGQRTEDEAETVGNMLGDGTKLAGFYSYGEIGPNNVTGLANLHNQTVTLTLIGEVA